METAAGRSRKGQERRAGGGRIRSGGLRRFYLACFRAATNSSMSTGHAPGDRGAADQHKGKEKSKTVSAAKSGVGQTVAASTPFVCCSAGLTILIEIRQIGTDVLGELPQLLPQIGGHLQ